MSIRESIVTNMQTVMSGITVANGFNLDIVTVELAGRAWDETETRDAARPYIGLLPQRERHQERPGHLEVFWDWLIVAHATPSDRTLATNAALCSDITADIRKALYESPSLGLNDVIRVSLTGRMGSEGSPQAAQEKVASVEHNVTVHFIEGIHDA